VEPGTGKESDAMTLENMGYFKALHTRMSWLNQRQRVLAENVAHANTPGFRAKDLEEPNFQDILKKSVAPVAMATTSGQHLQGGISAGKVAFNVQDTDAATDKSGNSVVLEAEMMKVSQTTADHELMSNLYRKGIDLMRVAISRPARG